MEKILIIDDEDLLREGIRLELEAEDYDVIEAPNGKKGCEYARQYLPDLILCDVNMPDMNGRETLELLRKDAVTSTIPVILMTGVLKEYSDIRQAMMIGADDYILKPFTIPELLRSIQSRLQKQLDLKRKAESKLEDLRLNIATSLPHEFRIPLTAIMGFSDLLQEEYRTLEREEIGDMARMIQQSALRLHTMIEEYIDYSQIELISMNEQKQHTLKREVLGDVQGLVKALAERKAEEAGRSQDLKLELSTGTVRISEIHLKKIISNLLDNAFKFSKPDTTVQVVCREKDEWFTLAMNDHGRGMTAEQISRVGGYMQFERNVYEQQGSGLGLIIAKRLCEIYGGDFNIESNLNLGTVITIKLPIA